MQMWRKIDTFVQLWLAIFSKYLHSLFFVHTNINFQLSHMIDCQQIFVRSLFDVHQPIFGGKKSLTILNHLNSLTFQLINKSITQSTCRSVVSKRAINLTDKFFFGEQSHNQIEAVLNFVNWKQILGKQCVAF